MISFYLKGILSLFNCRVVFFANIIWTLSWFFFYFNRRRGNLFKRIEEMGFGLIYWWFVTPYQNWRNFLLYKKPNYLLKNKRNSSSKKGKEKETISLLLFRESSYIKLKDFWKVSLFNMRMKNWAYLLGESWI